MFWYYKSFKFKVFIKILWIYSVYLLWNIWYNSCWKLRMIMKFLVGIYIRNILEGIYLVDEGKVFLY